MNELGVDTGGGDGKDFHSSGAVVCCEFGPSGVKCVIRLLHLEKLMLGRGGHALKDKKRCDVMFFEINECRAYKNCASL